LVSIVSPMFMKGGAKRFVFAHSLTINQMITKTVMGIVYIMDLSLIV